MCFGSLYGRGPGVTDIYPLSPMQGLYHSLAGSKLDVGIDQWHFTLQGPLDPDAYWRAWEAVVNQHESLRCSYTVDADGLAQPLQVVHGRVTVQWHNEDWRAQDAGLGIRIDLDLGFELACHRLDRLEAKLLVNVRAE